VKYFCKQTVNNYQQQQQSELVKGPKVKGDKGEATSNKIEATSKKIESSPSVEATVNHVEEKASKQKSADGVKKHR
jgi:hypothetical protein